MGTGTCFPFSLLQDHVDSSCAQLFCHIRLSPGALCCGTHCRAPQSPVLNLHTHEWIKVTHMLLPPIAHQTIYSATCSIASVKQGTTGFPGFLKTRESLLQLLFSHFSLGIFSSSHAFFLEINCPSIT